MAAIELNSSVIKTVLSSNLKAYYQFNTGQLTTDSSGNSKTLTNNNTVGEGTGVFGGCADFGTSNTNKSLTIADALAIDGGTISISFWVKLSAEIGSSTWVLADQGNTNSKVIYFIAYDYNAGTRRLRFARLRNASGEEDVNFNITLGTSSWYHLVITYDGVNVRGYVNGACVGTTPSSGNGSGGTTSGVTIGAYTQTGTLFSSALIDDVAYFSIALSADQIKELYEGRTVGELWPQSGLVGLWHLNGNSTDFSGNNNHGTDANITYSLTNGKFGQGAGFNGSSSRITLPVAVKPTSGSYTIFVWNKPGTNADKMVYSSDPNNLYYCSYNSTTSKYTFGCSGGTLVTNRTYTTNTWHLCILVLSGTTFSAYVDGWLEGSTAVTPSYAYNTTNITYGGMSVGFYDYTTPGNWFSGAIDELAIFNVAKDAAWVRKQYAFSVGKYGGIL